eukprot:6207947-Pleurochrysis_carterae.AAC.5
MPAAQRGPEHPLPDLPDLPDLRRQVLRSLGWGQTAVQTPGEAAAPRRRRRLCPGCCGAPPAGATADSAKPPQGLSRASAPGPADSARRRRRIDDLEQRRVGRPAAKEARLCRLQLRVEERRERARIHSRIALQIDLSDRAAAHANGSICSITTVALLAPIFFSGTLAIVTTVVAEAAIS